MKTSNSSENIDHNNRCFFWDRHRDRHLRPLGHLQLRKRRNHTT